ncbi:hypothetical protein [Legionella bononiensis]|nr:hypothetical protein [Legionella bononiensis]
MIFLILENIEQAVLLKTGCSGFLKLIIPILDAKNSTSLGLK